MIDLADADLSSQLDDDVLKPGRKRSRVKHAVLLRWERRSGRSTRSCGLAAPPSIDRILDGHPDDGSETSDVSSIDAHRAAYRDILLHRPGVAATLDGGCG